MSYSVFIERAVDGSPEGVRDVAERVGKRFGAPTEALIQRLSSGRFRVKANVDLEKARRFAEELERLGAEASICDAAGERVDSGAAAAPEPSVAPERVAAGPSGSYQSGLAAAFSGDSQQDLGALGGADLNTGDALRLSSLDGEDGGTVAADERAPSAVSPAMSVAEDAFLPPEMSDEAKDLELLTPLPRRLDTSGDGGSDGEATAAAPARVAGTPTVHPGSAAALLAQDTPPGKGPPAWLQTLAENERSRLIFAVVLSLLVGFALAHVMATMQEDSAYSAIRQELSTLQSKVDNSDDWNKLDPLRASALERMQAKKRNIAISSVAIMLVVCALLTFLIVRKVPWDRYLGRPVTRS